MTNPESDNEAKAREAAARQRYFALTLIRLTGVALVMFGFLIIRQRFDWVQGNNAKIMGTIIAFVGLFQALIVPRALIRAWRTPPQ